MGLPIGVRIVSRENVYSRDKNTNTPNRLPDSLLNITVPEQLPKSQPVVEKPLKLVKKNSDPQIKITPVRQEFEEKPPSYRLRRGSFNVSAQFIEHHHHSLPGLAITPPRKKAPTFIGLYDDDNSLKLSDSTPVKELLSVKKEYSLPPVEITFENDWVEESQSELIEPSQFGFHTEVGDRGLPVEKFDKPLFNIEIPLQENLYEKYFYQKSLFIVK